MEMGKVLCGFQAAFLDREKQPENEFNECVAINAVVYNEKYSCVIRSLMYEMYTAFVVAFARVFTILNKSKIPQKQPETQ